MCSSWLSLRMPKAISNQIFPKEKCLHKNLVKKQNNVWHQQKARFEYVLKCFHLAELWFWMIMIYHGWSKVGRSESVAWRLGQCQAERAWLLHTIVTGSIPSPHSTHAWWVFSALNALFEYLIATLLQHFLYLPCSFSSKLPRWWWWRCLCRWAEFFNCCKNWLNLADQQLNYATLIIHCAKLNPTIIFLVHAKNAWRRKERRVCRKLGWEKGAGFYYNEGSRSEKTVILCI